MIILSLTEDKQLIKTFRVLNTLHSSGFLKEICTLFVIITDITKSKFQRNDMNNNFPTSCQYNLFFKHKWRRNASFTH